MTDQLHPESSRSLRWYQGLDRYCWIVLVIAALGWLFDTMDQNLFNLVRAPSLTDLLRPHYPPDQLADAVRQKGGLLTSVFLIGWSVGGFLFGILGDRLGRTRTMVLTILIYAIFTGLSGLASNWQFYAFMRFMTGLGVGGEWAAGAALVAETFPSRSRPMALGFLQALSAVGNMMACVITLIIPNLEHNWRWAYFVGAAPALLVLWIRRSVKEPAQWHEARESAKTLGKELGSIGELFSNPILRRRTIAATLMGTAGVGALWGVANFSTDMVRAEMITGNIPRETFGTKISLLFLAQQVGAFFGMYCCAVVAERTSRRMSFFIFFALAWASILAFFWGIQGSGASAFTRAMILAPLLGFGTLGPFAGYTIYFPELFPTRLRSTGCGFCYNAARVLAASAPFALGNLASRIGGFAQAASVVSCVLILGFIGAVIGPETRGKPLPEDADLLPAEAEPVPVGSR